MQVQGALPGDYKSRLCITSKGGYFVLGGIMRAKTLYISGIMMLAIMLLCGLAATADATVVVAAPGVSITIANRAITSQKFGGDITITGTASDMALSTTISLILPSGLKFDTSNVALQIGTNISCTGGFAVSHFTGTGYTSGYSSDGRTIKLNVDSTPTTGSGTIKFRSNMLTTDDLAVVPVNPSNTSIDSTGLQFSVVTNGDTGYPVTTTVGTINILKVPTILSATCIDSTHFTIQFNCTIDLSTATGHSTALGSGKDYSTASSIYGLYIGNAATPVTNATAFIDSSDPTKVNVTIYTGAIRLDNTSTIQTTTTSQQFVNAKDTATTPTITSIHTDAPHTAINIICFVDCWGSTGITVSKTTVGCSTGFIDPLTGRASNSATYCPFVAGRPLDSNSQILDDAFITTIYTCSGFAYKVRLAYYSATTTVPLTSNNNAWQADCVSGSTTVLFDDTSSSGKHSITGANNDGALQIYFQLKDGLGNSNSNLASGYSGQIKVQASLDDFATTSGIISSDPITVDRIVPTVDSSVANAPKATSNTTVQVIFSEAVKKSTVEVSSAFNVESPIGTDRAVQAVSLGSDNKTTTITSTVMPPGCKSSKIITSPVSEVGLGTTPTYVTDLVGNRCAETSSIFTSLGECWDNITVTQPSTTPPRVANGNILTVQVNTETSATVQVRLANSTNASTTTSYWDTGAVTLTEVTTGVYRTVSTFPTVNASASSGSIKVIASTDEFATRTIDDETVTLDNTGPSLVSANAIGNRNVLVNFNETLYTASSSVTASNFSISPTTGVVGISSATAQPSKTAVLLSFTGTASTGITYTVTANSSVKDETTINGVGTANSATFTTTGPDTTAPTISSIEGDADDCRITVCFTDNSGSAAVDTNCTRINSVTKGGTTVSGTITCDATNACCTFTPTHCPLEAGTYVVNLTVCDLAGNTALLSISFTVYGNPACSANPATITISGGTSTITASGGLAPYTAAITSDTTGGATLTGSSLTFILTPGTTAGSNAVTITDSQSRTSTCTVTYTPCVLTVAATKSAANNEKILVGANGGTPPYVFELTTTQPTGAAIDPVSGDYLAPAAGATAETETIKATDPNGCTGETTVKISTDSIAITSYGSGTSFVVITGPDGATYTIDDGVGSVTSIGVYTSAEDGVGIVKVSKGGEWTKVVIRVENGICTVIEPTPAQDVNMDGAVDVNDLTPVIDWILK
jgi:hypothetical protein